MKIEDDLRQCWATPSNFFKACNDEFDFQFDAAATRENTKCDLFLSPESDSLSGHPWVSLDILPRTRVWLNPGFRNMAPWVERAHAEAQRHPNAVVCVLGPLSAAPWLTDFCAKNATEIRDIYPRIQFVPPPGIPASSNGKDNVLIVFRRKTVKHPAQRFLWRWK